MEPLTALERAALDALVDEVAGDHKGALRKALARASVVSRENTGAGFFSDLRVDTSEVMYGNRHLGETVWIAVDGLDYGLGMILHIKDGCTALLEGYAVGPEDTSQITFATVRFAVVAEPGPLT